MAGAYLHESPFVQNLIVFNEDFKHHIESCVDQETDDDHDDDESDDEEQIEGEPSKLYLRQDEDRDPRLVGSSFLLSSSA